MKPIFSIARKEINSYFSSPMALIFVAIFLAAALFTFFWVDQFFSRGLADVRPLFRWMPLLMIFLVAALTMRQWSEEQQLGTLEVLFTLPIKLYQLVLGKFLAVLALVATALALTVFLPITVSQLGDLDYGPVLGGYMASLLMAAAYIAIGLFVSSRSSNQIVSLILTGLVCGLLHLVGTREITELFSTGQAEVLRAIGTGSRFESIERGVIDLRDLVYYLSLTAGFLALNVFSLDTKRWGRGLAAQDYRFNWQAGVSLLTANLIALNVILFPFTGARLDLTQNQDYSLSPATEDVLANLSEPLTIRGYFSEENHPLLSPLVPQIRDFLAEYEIAADGDVELEIIDPITDSDIEAEANQIYGIRPEALPLSTRYAESVINVYFHILIRYGDQNVVLGLNDLIVAEQFPNGDINIRLNNLEYQLTRNIKRVVQGFQSVDSVLASLEEPAQLTLYYTPDTLPESLAEGPAIIEKVAGEIAAVSNGKFIYTAVDVNDPSDNIDERSLAQQYGLQPLAENFFSPDTYYLHMVLIAGGKGQVIYPSSSLSETEINDLIEGALARSASGFLKVVGVWTPPNVPEVDAFGQQQASLQQFQTVQEALREDYEVLALDLTTGRVPVNIDILLVIAPQNLSDRERYAIDQFLMRGGTVFVAAGNYQITFDQFSQELGLEPLAGNLNEMLASYGVIVEPSLVLDPQNEPFVQLVSRNVGGQQVQEIQVLPYPYFVDVRSDGMGDNPMLADLTALTLNWASPVTVDESRITDPQVTTLFESSPESWQTTSTDLGAFLDTYLATNSYLIEGEQGRNPLGVIVQGSFTSFFKDKASPFTDVTPSDPTAAATPEAALSLSEQSAPSARLIVVGSSEFLNDNILGASADVSGDRYLNTLLFIQNLVDWSTEDTDLLSIRARGDSARLLDPLEEDEQRNWEYGNYAAAILSVILLGVLWQVLRRNEAPMPLVLPESANTQSQEAA